MYSNIAQNKRKTWLILAGFVAFVGAIGFMFGYLQNSPGLSIGILIGAFVYAIVMYYASSKIALTMSGAQQIEKSENPRLWNTVENLSITAGLPMPEVYIVNDDAPNAFATGRDPENAAVAATTGLLNQLDDSELQGVMAHELSHVGNYDIRVSMIALALVAAIGFISDIFIRMMWFGGNDRRDVHPVLMVVGFVMVILSPIIAAMIKSAVSRQREYLADASGVMLTRYPEGLANALRKISSYNQPVQKASSSTAHLYFSNPLKGKISKLFSTHPPAEERIQRIMQSGKEL